MELIDTHSHLYLPDFSEDIDAVLQRCADNHVRRILLPNIDSSTIKSLNSLVEDYPDVFHAMMGLHPCYVKKNYKEELATIEQELRNNIYIAVGEIGLDYYWDKSFKSEQIEAFENQITWAKELNLPVVIHSRESFDEIITILKPLCDDRLKGVFHCFTGNVEDAAKAVEMGFYLGIGGVVTFKNSGLDRAVEQIDLDYIVLETDSPYLAPSPYRGKRNESSYAKIIANKISEIKKIPVEEVASVTSANARKLFKI